MVEEVISAFQSIIYAYMVKGCHLKVPKVIWDYLKMFMEMDRVYIFEVIHNSSAVCKGFVYM